MDLYQEQVRLEEQSRDLSIARFHKAHTDAMNRQKFGETFVGRKILSGIIQDFSEEIEKYLEETTLRHKAHKLLKTFNDNDAVAYLFTKAVLNLVPIRATATLKTSAGKHFGTRRSLFFLQATDMLHDELRLRHFNDNFPSIMRNVIKNCEVRNLTRYRKRALFRKEFDQQKIEWKHPDWTHGNRIHLGMTLLHLFNKVTGMIEKVYVSTGKNKRSALLFATPEFQKLLEEMLRSHEYLRPIHDPMVYPPRPWHNDKLVGSGYLTNNIPQYKLVKKAKMGWLRELETTDLTIPLRAMNAVQSTPWRVNTVILEAARTAYEENYGVEDLPPSSDIDLPPLPPGLEKGSQEWKQNMADVALTHRLNRKAISKRVSFLSVLSVAEKFSKYEKIYFPHQMDSRGRIYPVPTHLNPQGPGYVKALLEFGEGKPIEDRTQVEYLAIAGANAFGHDKLPLKERIDWVWDNEEMFESIATNWREDRRWVHADSPFEFLRFCLEWKALGDHGPGFISHMPINFDATCSGLQHFSAILKDEVGGTSVNLRNLEERQDIYQDVASKAEASIKRDLDRADKAGVARIALDTGITRALAKRPVMIVPYSGTFKACMGYTQSHYLKMFEDGAADFGGFGEQYIIRTLTPYVAKHLWAAINDTVIKAREAMNWIGQVAGVVTKSSRKDEPLLWTTPAGFTVRQHNLAQTEKVIHTYIDGDAKHYFRQDTKKVNYRKVRQALSPNFIHSMDAAHLQLTVCAALDTGRDMSFAMIHDSFGVHAADMEVFINECVRPEFVKMYKDSDVLGDFARQISTLLDPDQELPERPTRGNLDLTEVLQSEFFFS